MRRDIAVKTPCIDLHIPMLMAKGLQSIQRIKNECSRSDVGFNLR